MVHYLLSKLIERLSIKTFETSEPRGVEIDDLATPRYQGAEADDDSSSVSA